MGALYMKFIIKGYSRRYGSKKTTTQVYGIFDDRAECYRYLNTLKSGFLHKLIKFYVEEEPECRKGNTTRRL